jgi:transglutaminase-like putative cysteine protease
MFKLEEGWLTVFLVCALMFVSAAGVEACQWADGLWTAWCAGLVGVLAGLALAKSHFKGPTAALFATVYGIFVVGFFIGFLLPGDWHARSVELAERMGTFVLKLILGGASRDALPFPVLISSLFWLMSVSGAFMLFRRGAVWPVILPAGLMLVINAYYYQGPANLNVYVIFYALAALLLLGYTSLLAREREWRQTGVIFNPEIRLDFLRAGVAVALAGIMVAWIAPSVRTPPEVVSVWQQANGYWSTVRETWMRMFAAVRGTGQIATDYYGDSLALGGPVHLSATPIMDVSVGLIGGETEAGPEVPARYYWRAAAFERYANGQWLLGDTEFKEANPEAPVLRLPPYKLRRDVSAIFNMRLLSTSRLYVASQPRLTVLANNIPAIYSVIVAPDGSADVSVVRARDVLVGDERTYRLVASLSVADEDSLRSAGTQYPLWVASRYLQLPPEITVRTRQLARQIVDRAPANTPYDQAQAITDWLRINIKYNQFIEAPPSGTEPVDWFLFTSHQGYCNYYASSEVVMLRSLGIPARLAAGFSQGVYDETSSSPVMAVYHVQEKQAHAWVEVFFPGYGWVEFEPTATEAPLVRPARQVRPPVGSLGTAPAPAPTVSPRATAEPASRPLSLAMRDIDWGQVGEVAIIVLGVVAGVVVAVVGLLLRLGLLGWESLGRVGAWAMRLRRQALPSAIGAVYLRLERAARWLSLSLPATLTPHERAERLSLAVPLARPGVETITAQYVQEKYSGRPADAQAARAAWLDIRFKVWREGLRHFLRRFKKVDKVNGRQINPDSRTS